MRDGKGVHTNIGIHVITRVQGRRKGGGGGGGSKHVKGMINHQLKEIYTTWACILSDCDVLCTLRGGGKWRRLMPLGLFLF